MFALDEINKEVGNHVDVLHAHGVEGRVTPAEEMVIDQQDTTNFLN